MHWEPQAAAAQLSRRLSLSLVAAQVQASSCTVCVVSEAMCLLPLSMLGAQTAANYGSQLCRGSVLLAVRPGARCMPTGFPEPIGSTSTLACTGTPEEERHFSLPSI